jgi:hypothetical protein
MNEKTFLDALDDKVLTVVDVACAWVKADDDPPPYTGLMFELSHPDMSETFHQLYRLSPTQLAKLYGELAAHDHPPM